MLHTGKALAIIICLPHPTMQPISDDLDGQRLSRRLVRCEKGPHLIIVFAATTPRVLYGVSSQAGSREWTSEKQ